MRERYAQNGIIVETENGPCVIETETQPAIPFVALLVCLTVALICCRLFVCRRNKKSEENPMMRKKVLIVELLQFLAFIGIYNLLFTITQNPYDVVDSYLFCFLPVLIFSVPQYMACFLVRKTLFRFVPHRFVSFLLILLSYLLIAALIYLFFNRVLQNDPIVTCALSQGVIYAQLSILPFLLADLASADIRHWPFRSISCN